MPGSKYEQGYIKLSRYFSAAFAVVGGLVGLDAVASGAKRLDIRDVIPATSGDRDYVVSYQASALTTTQADVLVFRAQVPKFSLCETAGGDEFANPSHVGAPVLTGDVFDIPTLEKCAMLVFKSIQFPMGAINLVEPRKAC